MKINGIDVKEVSEDLVTKTIKIEIKGTKKEILALHNALSFNISIPDTLRDAPFSEIVNHATIIGKILDAVQLGLL